MTKIIKNYIRKILLKNYFLYRVGIVINVFFFLLLLPILTIKDTFEGIVEMYQEAKELWSTEAYHTLKQELLARKVPKPNTSQKEG